MPEKVRSEKFNKQLFIVVGGALILALAGYLALRASSLVNFGKPNVAEEKSDQRLLEQQKSKDARDQESKNRISTVNSAIKSFFLTEKRAPGKLEELVPKYLTSVPTDSTGKPYVYKVAASRRTWTIETVLSDGSVFEVEGP